MGAAMRVEAAPRAPRPGTHWPEAPNLDGEGAQPITPAVYNIGGCPEVFRMEVDTEPRVHNGTRSTHSGTEPGVHNGIGDSSAVCTTAEGVEVCIEQPSGDRTGAWPWPAGTRGIVLGDAANLDLVYLDLPSSLQS